MKNMAWRLAVVLLFLLNIFLFSLDINLKKSIVNIEKNKEKQFQDMLSRERSTVMKQKQAKYNDAMAAYAALAKKMDIERSKQNKQGSQKDSEGIIKGKAQ
ncbi:MAG: hypothetical protein WCY12_05935 [Candidatus Omnitrophota bacterium]